MISSRKLSLSLSLFCLAASPAGVSPALAEDPVRITDLTPGDGSGVPNLDAAVLLDKLYFAGTASGANDLDLWVYDGVSAPTMVPGSGELGPEELTVWQGALYFEAGPFADRELWRYDGVNPPVEVLDLFPAGSGQPTNLVAFGPEICFGAFPTAEGDQFVCWDGATAPDVYELRTGGGARPKAMTVIGSTLYFDAYGDGVGSEPWRRENFVAPSLVGDLRPGISSSNPEAFVQIDAATYIRAASTGGISRVWTFDGVEPPELLSPTFRLQGGIAAWGDRLLAVGYEEGESFQPLGGISELHVWRESGFAPAPWEGGSTFAANSFLDHRNALYFRATTSPTASDLFRYCGGENVQRVTDQFADDSYVSSSFIVFQGLIYFSAFAAEFGQELWALDPLVTLFCDGFGDGNLDAWSSSVP